MHLASILRACLAALFAAVACLSLCAQYPVDAASYPVRTANAPSPSSRNPADINGHRTIIASPAVMPAIRVAIYQGPGASSGGVNTLRARALQIPGSTVELLSADDFRSVDLRADFDIVVFPGGSGSGQGDALGEEGRERVRAFIRDGGGFVGVCAGAYLACSNFPWGLHILNARTKSSQWKRGSGFVEMDLTQESRGIFGEVEGNFMVRYVNGPIIEPMGRDDLPSFVTLGHFRTEIAENNTPVGIQVNSPAFAASTYGRGRVFISSPHPENTPGLEHIIPRAMLWAAGHGPDLPGFAQE